jgi:hypothetical protein
VDGTVVPQESNCRHRKGIQADFQHDENKEANDAVSNAPPEVNSSVEVNPSREQLNALTNVMLKEKLKERGLKRTGKKEDLVNRLLEDFDASSTESKKLIGKKKDELKHLLIERGLSAGGNKTDMVDRLLGREKTTRRKVKWTKSPARALLKKLLLDEKSYVHGKAAEDVYASHDWFQDYPPLPVKKIITGA